MLARNIFYFACLATFVALSSIRSSPIYGKMDFYLLEEAPWREPWRPMIEKVLAAGTQPIVSDMITETVFRGVYAQPSPGFRYDPRFAHIDIEELVPLRNGPKYALAPVGAWYLLLRMAQRDRKQILEIFSWAADRITMELEKEENNTYRCIINLHDVPPSWVPYETGHWSPLWSQPSHIYAFHGKRGKELRQLLRDSPPPGCMVFF